MRRWSALALLIGSLGCDDGGGVAVDPDGAVADAMSSDMPRIDMTDMVTPDMAPDLAPDMGPSADCAPPAAYKDVTIDGWTVQVDRATGAWAVRSAGGAVVLASAPRCVDDAPGDDGMLDVPPTELPVYVRPGTILPLLGDVVDSFYGATAEGVTDLSDVADRWRLGLYPSATGELRALDWRYTVALGGAVFGSDRAPTPLIAIDTPIEAVRRICPQEPEDAPEE